METLYIHYGHKNFDPFLFQPIINRPGFNKPHGGLWASSTTANFGWKEWTEREAFCSCDKENSFLFYLKNPEKIYHIFDVVDVQNMPRTNQKDDFMILPDFEQMLKTGYDAIEFHLSSDFNGLYWALYGWDCDSILVLNPDAICIKKKPGLILALASLIFNSIRHFCIGPIPSAFNRLRASAVLLDKLLVGFLAHVDLQHVPFLLGG